MIKIPFGYKNENIVHISEVESGLSCNCICIGCGGQLEAHKGKTLHYFKHKNNNSNCKTSLETYLHQLAKKIIFAHKKIVLPPVYKGTELLYASKEVIINEVAIENKLHNIVPDLICKIKDKELLIEIKVTNEISAKKREIIESLKIATIEISLSKNIIYNHPNSIEELILKGVYNKKWIYNSLTSDYINEQIKNDLNRLLNTNLLVWKTIKNKPVRQVHCKNINYFDNLIKGYKADLYKNCKACEYYIIHDNDGVYCNYSRE